MGMIKFRYELFNSPKKRWMELMFNRLVELGAFANMEESERQEFLRVKDSCKTKD
jgi:hypothetical protein